MKVMRIMNQTQNNKIKYVIIVCFLGAIIFFCNNCKKIDHETDSIIVHEIDTINIPFKKDQIGDLYCNVLDSIDLFKIKANARDWNSSFFSMKEIKNYGLFIPEGNVFFTYYLLFYENEDVKDKNMVQVIAYNSEKPSKFSSHSERLIQMLIYGDKVSVFYDLSNGMPISSYINKLGSPIYNTDTISVFRIGDNQFLSAKLENDTVKTIKIGHYNYNFDNDKVKRQLMDFSM